MSDECEKCGCINVGCVYKMLALSEWLQMICQRCGYHWEKPVLKADKTRVQSAPEEEGK